MDLAFILLNLTSIHAISALTEYGNVSRTNQNGVRFWRLQCSMKGVLTTDNDSEIMPVHKDLSRKSPWTTSARLFTGWIPFLMPNQ